MTYAQGRRAWDLLTKRLGENQEQLVEIERLPIKGRGRPASRYRLSAKLVKALQKSPSASEHHAEEIASLAKTTRLPIAKDESALLFDGRSTGLLLSNRWLLMVLLAHADSPGIVTRLSVSALRRLTGMSRYRITSQLKKLSNLGLMAHHQPGRYSPKAGTRKTSIYLLDLAHPLLGSFKRTPITIVSNSSTNKLKGTELVGGIVDAVMTLAVCRIQHNELSKGNDAIVDPEAPNANAKSRQPSPPLSRYKIIERVSQSTSGLLPSARFLRGGLEELFNSYDADNADWLLTSIHIDACLLLSSAWGSLKNMQLGPSQPCHDIIVNTAQRLGLKPEYTIEKSVDHDTKVSTNENHQCFQSADNCSIASSTDERVSYHPFAVLSYALSYHLALNLQKSFSKAEQFEVEAITYMLIPDFSDVSSSHQRPTYQLRGYGVGDSGDDTAHLRITFIYPVDEDLHSYWRTYHHRCLSAISDEPDDSATDTAEPAD